MEAQELAGRLYRDLAPLLDAGDEEGTVRTVARYFMQGLEPEQLFGILARLGSRRYAYERFAENIPAGYLALNACYTMARRLPREEGVLALLQAAVVMAHDAPAFASVEVTPFTGFPQEELPYLGEALLRGILTRNLDRADGALERLLKQHGGREWAGDMLLLVASFDLAAAGRKLVMATQVLEAAARLKWELAFGMLRPVVHCLSCCQDEKQRRRTERWVAEADVEDRTAFANARELSLREAAELADAMLRGEARRALNHALRNGIALRSLADALVVAACEWLSTAGDTPKLRVGLSRFVYAHAVRAALEMMNREPLWPLFAGAAYVGAGWTGESLSEPSLEMELADPDEFARWAAGQDGAALGLELHLFAHAFIREDSALSPELKPYLFKAVQAVRRAATESVGVRQAFNSLVR